MNAWPTSVRYHDPTTGERADVTLPKTREEAKRIYAEIRRMLSGQASDLKRMIRMWTQIDLYVLGLLSSAADRDDPYLGRPEIDCDVQFEQARDVQFDSNRVIDYGARSSWKHLAIDTPIPTPTGWTTIGRLAVGDEVYDGNGEPTVVIGVSDPTPCEKRVRFGGPNGPAFLTSGEHRWWVERENGQNKYERRFVTTNEIQAHAKKARYRVRLPGLKGPEVELPIAPYALGVWLGDGCHSNSSVGMSALDYPEIAHRIEDAGEAVAFCSERDDGLALFRLGTFSRCGHRGPRNSFLEALKGCGILGNKRIPRVYLRAGRDQRKQLLMGLMDTDGYVPEGERASYVSCSNAPLANDIEELIASLGYRVRHHVLRKGYGMRPEHRLEFCPERGDGVVGLWRKAQRLPEQRGRNGRLWSFYEVEDLERPVLGQCIAVASSAATFLAGREMITTGNSTWKVFLKTIQDLMKDPDESIAFMAHEKEAAVRHLKRVMIELETNDILKAGWAPDVFWLDPRNKELSLQWSASSGVVIPGRKIASICPSVGAYTFVGKLPTGARFSRIKLDDCETEATVESEEMCNKMKRRFRNMLNTLGRGGILEMNGTIHLGTGLITELLEQGWRGRCRKAEDESEPAPDIAAIYDELGGIDPATGGKIPRPVREVKLAGKPVFWHPIECAIKRWEQGDATYNQQNMGSAQAGQIRRFDPEWFRWYEETPEERADGQNLYIVVDPSKGVGDPVFIFVVAAHCDQTFSIVDGLRRRLTPTEFHKEMYFLVTKWMGLGTIVTGGIRIEEFAQAAFSIYLNEYFGRYKLDVPAAIACNTTHKNTEHQRDWIRLEPLFRRGMIYFPRKGIRVEDEGGRVYDLISDYFIPMELAKFPAMERDDGLAALSLLSEPIDKVGPILWTEHDRKPRGRREEFEELTDLQEPVGSWQMGMLQ